MLIISKRLPYPPVHLFSICSSAESNSIKHSALSLRKQYTCRCWLSNAITHTQSSRTLGQRERTADWKEKRAQKTQRNNNSIGIFLSVLPFWRKFFFLAWEKKQVWQSLVQEENNVRLNLLQICMRKDELNHHSPTEIYIYGKRIRGGNLLRSIIKTSC